MPLPEILALRKDCFGATPKVRAGLAIAPETSALPERIRTNQTGRFSITSYLQLRELDLLGSHRFGGHRPPPQQADIIQLSFFFLRRSFFACGFIAALAAASAGRLTQPPLQHE